MNRVRIRRSRIVEAGYPADHSVWKLFWNDATYVDVPVLSEWRGRGAYAAKTGLRLQTPDGRYTTVLTSQVEMIEDDAILAQEDE